MLDLALEYVEALRNAVPDAPREPRPESQDAREALTRAYRLSHRAILLFGPDSPAGEQAIEAYFLTLRAFDHAQQPLDIDERLADGESAAKQIWLADHEKVEVEAERSVDRFSSLAGRAIRSGGRHPWMDHGRHFRRWIFRSREGREIRRQLRKVGAERRRNADEFKAADAELRRALDEAEAQGVEIPDDIAR